MGNGINRIGNTLALPVRVGGTVVTTTADLANTLLYNLPKEGLEVLGNTTQQIKDVLLGAWNHGKWYHKAMNIPLSPIVAGGTAFEGVVRSVVQPVINGVVNTRNTGKNFFTNTFRNIGRVFSKKPISDFSYDHVKTRPLTLNNWFAKLQFKKGQVSRGNDKEKTTVVAPIITEKKDNDKKDAVEETKKPEEVKEEKIEEKQSQDKKTNNKKDEKTQNKTQDKKTETKKNAQEEKRKESTEKKEESDSAKEFEASLKNSKHGTKIFQKIKKDYPELKFVVDDSSSVGSVVWSAPKIGVVTIGGKIPSDERQIAPLNSSKDVEKQKSHVMLHELGHIIILENTENKNLKQALEISNKYIKTGKTLTPIAHLSIYDSTEKKTKEDLAEMLSLFATKNEDLDTYLAKLSSDKKEDEEYRKKFELAKIDKEEVKKLKNACTELISLYK